MSVRRAAVRVDGAARGVALPVRARRCGPRLEDVSTFWFADSSRCWKKDLAIDAAAPGLARPAAPGRAVDAGEERWNAVRAVHRANGLGGAIQVEADGRDEERLRARAPQDLPVIGAGEAGLGHPDDGFARLAREVLAEGEPGPGAARACRTRPARTARPSRSPRRPPRSARSRRSLGRRSRRRTRRRPRRRRRRSRESGGAHLDCSGLTLA